MTKISRKGWGSLLAELDEARSAIQLLRLQPPPGQRFKAARSAASRIADGNLIRTESVAEYEDLQDWFRLAVEGEAQLRKAIQKREISLSFIILWGDFMYRAGILSHANGSLDERRVRAGSAGGKARSVKDRMIWMSRELLTRINANESRIDAERNIEKELKTLIVDKTSSEYEWLSGFLHNDKVLKETYRRKRLPLHEVKSLAVQADDAHPRLPMTYRSAPKSLQTRR